MLEIARKGYARAPLWLHQLARPGVTYLKTAARRLAMSSGRRLRRPFRASDVFLMHEADRRAWDAYQPDVIAWGHGASSWRILKLHRRGIRYVASVWVLTAGAKNLHLRPDLAAATARDLYGQPIVVPWRPDISYRGTRELFGCSNHPRFRAFVMDHARAVLAAGPDGLHVDDHLGSAQTVPIGGCFCDYCLAGFRRYLKEHLTPELQADLGADLRSFDYREFLIDRVSDKADYLRRRRQLPFAGLFEKYHLEAAAGLTEALADEARRVIGAEPMLSANVVLPDLRHLVVGRLLSHYVGEISHIAGAQGDRFSQSEGKYHRLFAAYRLADHYRRPLLTTASLGDWAWVSAGKREELVRLWIALAYAHGHFFLAPAPDGQHAFDRIEGTRRYNAPIEEYAPVYHFIRKHSDWFDGFDEMQVLNEGSDGVRVVLRRNPASGRIAIHLLDLAYDGSERLAPPRSNLELELPSDFMEPCAMRLFSFRQPPVELTKDGSHVRVPAFRLWGVVGVEGPAAVSMASRGIDARRTSP